MEKSEHQLNVESIRETYHYLDLTFSQAEKVLEYEELRKAPLSKHIISIWEEWDYELLVFEGILNENQRVRFDGVRNELYTQYVKNCTVQDEEIARWTDFHRAKNDYLKNNLIPTLLTYPSPVFPPVFHAERNKIDYLKASYKAFLHESGKEAVVTHVRLFKTYAPSRWKQTLLAHYTKCLLPDYWAFECAMDVPTKAVAQYLKKQLYRQTAELVTFQNQKLQDYKAFNRSTYEKFYQTIKGWHAETINPFTEEDEKVHWAMSLLLLDRDAYGFRGID